MRTISKALCVVQLYKRGLPLTFRGKTFLVPGDCEKDICQLLADKYGSALKSGILQIVHHGANGCCVAFYSAIDPEYRFWLLDAFRFYTDRRILGIEPEFEYNAWIRNGEISVRKHYHNSEDAEFFTDNA